MAKMAAICNVLIISTALAATPSMAASLVTFIFGDSLTEVGNNNFLQLSLAKSNYPFYGIDYIGGKATGRFTNGRTIGDIICNRLSVLLFFIMICFKLHWNFQKWNDVIFLHFMENFSFKTWDPFTPTISFIGTKWWCTSTRSKLCIWWSWNSQWNRALLCNLHFPTDFSMKMTSLNYNPIILIWFNNSCHHISLL